MDLSGINNLVTINLELITLISLGGFFVFYIWLYILYRYRSPLFVLAKVFKIKTPFFEKGYQPGTIDVWEKVNKKFHVNSMDMQASELGIKFKGTLLYPYIGGFLIPWERLKFVKTEKTFIVLKRSVFEVSGLGLFISIPESFKNNSRV